MEGRPRVAQVWVLVVVVVEEGGARWVKKRIGEEKRVVG